MIPELITLFNLNSTECCKTHLFYVLLTLVSFIFLKEPTILRNIDTAKRWMSMYHPRNDCVCRNGGKIGCSMPYFHFHPASYLYYNTISYPHLNFITTEPCLFEMALGKEGSLK